MKTKILFIVLALAFLIGTTYADDESMFIFSAKSDVMMILDSSGSMMFDVHGHGNYGDNRWLWWENEPYGTYSDYYGVNTLGYGIYSKFGSSDNNFLGLMGIETWNDLTNANTITYCSPLYQSIVYGHYYWSYYNTKWWTWNGYGSGSTWYYYWMGATGQNWPAPDSILAEDSRLWTCKSVMYYLLKQCTNIRGSLWTFYWYNDFSQMYYTYAQRTVNNVYSSGSNYYKTYQFPDPSTCWYTYTVGSPYINNAHKWSSFSDDLSSSLMWLDNRVDSIWTYDYSTYYYWGEFDARGGTPTKVAFDSAVVSYKREINLYDQGVSMCRKYYVLLLTDGLWNNAGDPKPVISALRSLSTDYGVKDVKTYVCGFTADPNLKPELDAMAVVGGTYHAYVSTNRQELKDSLEAIFAVLDSTDFSFSVAAIPTIRCQDSDSLLYVGSFIPSRTEFWDGSLECKSFNEWDTVTTTRWDLGENMKSVVWSTRSMYYEKLTGSNHQLTALNSMTYTEAAVASNATRDTLVRYLKGDTLYTHRADGSKLGDIFHSGPVLIDKGSSYYGGAGFDIFYKNVKLQRENNKIVYFGANDGFMHAAYANGPNEGTEAWAVAPLAIINQLKTLALYPRRHYYFFDGPSAISDARTGADTSNATNKGWQTIAITPMGPGNGNNRRFNGRYLFQIDLSYPDIYPTAVNAAFSFTDTASTLYSSRMGHVWSEPVIFESSATAFPWLAMVAFGYPYPDTATARINTYWAGAYVNAWDMKGKAWARSSPLSTYHFMVGSPSLYREAPDVWGYNRMMYMISPGLGGPGFCYGSWGRAYSSIYFFDISSNGIGNWGSTNGNGTGKEIFNSPNNIPRYFYASATVAKDPTDKLWMYFGSGNREEPLDTINYNYFYAVKDIQYLGKTGGVPAANETELGNVPTVSARGWKLALLKGEKVFTKPIVFKGIVYFTSYKPVNVEVCASGVGEARLYGIDYLTGAGRLGGSTTSILIGTGMPSAPVITIGPYGAKIMVMTSEGLYTYTETGMSGLSEDYTYWRRRMLE